MKNWDVILGALMTGLTLADLNVVIGCVCGLFTAAILYLRLRREWRHRNDPPEK